MTHTISGTFSTLVTFGSAIYDPTTITSSGLLNDGLQISFAGLTLLNAGSIAQGTANYGVHLLAGGSVTNQTGGSISATTIGILAEDAAVTVVNGGNMYAYHHAANGISYGIGIDLRAGGSVQCVKSRELSDRLREPRQVGAANAEYFQLREPPDCRR